MVISNGMPMVYNRVLSAIYAFSWQKVCFC